MQTAITTDRTCRARRLAILFGALLALGAVYVFIVLHFHVGLCWPFERLTGLSCPGCGISGLLLHLLGGDVTGAFWCNPVTFCLLPALLALVGYLMYRYVKHGDQKVPKWMNTAAVVTIGIYLIWGVVRNVPGFIN